MSAKIDKEVLDAEKVLIEERKTKALEKIAVSLDALTVWFEEIDKEDWDGRIQFYLSEWHNNLTQGKDK